MINNLFSIFDPSTSPNLSLNWSSLLIVFLFTPLIYWTIPSRIQTFWFSISHFLIKELKINFSKLRIKFIIIFISIFWLILTRNFIGLFPYIFTPTSHINISSFIAIPLWLTFIGFGWIKFTNSIFSHLVPLGTPIILSSFIVIIETIRNIIRPITLAIRLRANIISGHLLLCLLRNTLNNLRSIFPIIAPLLIILLILESAVAIIQSYVFITLSTLYLNEIN